MHYDPSAALARIDKDKGLLTLLITVFIKECPKYTAKLQAACDNQDLHALGDAAHNVKGASASIGLDAASSLAEELEVACRQSGVKSIASFEQSTARLVDVLNQCPEILNDWIKQNP
jgi:HPt (histidine-containing phosphotransfer) domain-containing protein